MPAWIDSTILANGQRLRLVINKPKGNVLSLDAIGELQDAITGAAKLPSLKLITIEGAGDHFSYGASVEEHAPGAVGEMLHRFHGFLADVLAAPAPTMAVVRGRCLGGGFELALACDFIAASETALFGVPEISLGVFPPAAAALLPSRIGSSRAASAILTGATQGAPMMLSHGLIELMTAAFELEKAVEAWFERHLAPRSAASLRYAARAARAELRNRFQTLIAELEILYLKDLMRTHDAVEGIAAFLDKRPPSWTDA